jgi:cell division protein FtsI/penicillin-binding protein 2
MSITDQSLSENKFSNTESILIKLIITLSAIFIVFIGLAAYCFVSKQRKFEEVLKEHEMVERKIIDEKTIDQKTRGIRYDIQRLR